MILSFRYVWWNISIPNQLMLYGNNIFYFVDTIITIQLSLSLISILDTNNNDNMINKVIIIAIIIKFFPFVEVSLFITHFLFFFWTYYTFSIWSNKMKVYENFFLLKLEFYSDPNLEEITFMDYNPAMKYFYVIIPRSIVDQI